MSKLPKQLQNQVDVAERFYSDDENKGSEASELVNTLTVENTAVEGDAVAETSEANTQGHLSAEDENSETYAQRWRTQQGIIASLNRKVEYADQRVAQLESLISNMQAAPVEAPAAVVKQHLTDADREEYGQDMVDFVNRAVAEGTESMRAENLALKQELARIKGVVPAVQQLSHQNQVSREDRFWNALTGAVSDWEAVNANSKFHAWLLESDPLTGITRDVYLKDAQRDLDVSRVANIFNSWKQQSVPSKQENTRNAARNELELQIAPGSKTGNNAPASVEEKRWSNQDIAKFYDDVRKGKFKGNEAEMKSIEQDIFRARASTA